MQLAPIAGLGLVLACGAAAAQSVTVYGVIDLAVEHIRQVGAAGGSLSRMPGLAGSVPSRLGLRGSEDLGGGLSAVFTLEQGFAPDTGTLNQGGRGFGRQSYVGLAGPWGTLTLGRQQTMLFWSLVDTDVLGPSSIGLGSLDSHPPNARADNALAYRASAGGLSLGATYSLGRDVVNAGPSPAGSNCPGENADDARQCRQWSLLLKYDSATWGGALAVDTLYGGPGAFAGLVSSALTDRRTVANAYTRAGDLKLSAGLLRRDNQASASTPRSDLWYLGAVLPLGLWTLEAELFRLRYKASANAANLAAVRATYNLSKRSAVYGLVGHIDNQGGLALSVSGGQTGSNPLPGRGQSGLMAGIRHVF